MSRDVWERRVLELLVWAFVGVVVTAFTAMVLAGVRSIREGQRVRCVTVEVAPAEVDCTWRGDR